LDNVVQLSELIYFDVLVVGVGDPFAIDDQAITISAGGERKGHAKFAGALAAEHDVGVGGPAVEIAGEGDANGRLEPHVEDDVAADLPHSIELRGRLPG